MNSSRSKFLTAPALAVAPASATMTAGQAHDSESVREKRRAHALCLSANSPGRIVEARTIAFPAIALHRIDTEGSGMPTWAKVLLGIIVVIVAIAVAVFFFTSGMNKTADEFFAEAPTGKLEQAYQNSSPAFKTCTTSNKPAALPHTNTPPQEK